MMKKQSYEFHARVKIIGINPYVSVPQKILTALFNDAGKDKGPVPIKGHVNGKPYLQTLMKYAGEWRLYINTIMLENSPKRIGEKISITLSFDPKKRTIEMHPALRKALNANKQARMAFAELSPSRQKEIIRYIAYLKTEEKINANVSKAIDFLTGKGNFAGRERP